MPFWSLLQTRGNCTRLQQFEDVMRLGGREKERETVATVDGPGRDPAIITPSLRHLHPFIDISSSLYSFHLYPDSYYYTFPYIYCNLLCLCAISALASNYPQSFSTISSTTSTVTSAVAHKCSLRTASKNLCPQEEALVPEHDLYGKIGEELATNKFRRWAITKPGYKPAPAGTVISVVPTTGEQE
jgi:hypothetical protein